MAKELTLTVIVGFHQNGHFAQLIDDMKVRTEAIIAVKNRKPKLLGLLAHLEVSVEGSRGDLRAAREIIGNSVFRQSHFWD